MFLEWEKQQRENSKGRNFKITVLTTSNKFHWAMWLEANFGDDFVLRKIIECWYSSCSVPRNSFFLSSVSKKIARESVDDLRFFRLYCIVYSQLVFVNIHKPLRFFFPGSWFIISEPDKIEDLRNLFTKKIFKRI